MDSRSEPTSFPRLALSASLSGGDKWQPVLVGVRVPLRLTQRLCTEIHRDLEASVQVSGEEHMARLPACPTSLHVSAFSFLPSNLRGGMFLLSFLTCGP